MNKIETVLKQGLEEFEVKLKDMDAYCASHSIMPFLEKNETWLKTFQKDLLAAVVAEVNGKMVDIPQDAPFQSWTPNEIVEAEDRNKTLQDIETLINNSTGV